MDKYSKLLQRAKETKKESKRIEFKEKIDVNSTGDWCEVIKDIVAIANSGGGIILFGVKNDGNYANTDISNIFMYDAANITNKIAKYTGVQFSEFEMSKVDWDGNEIVMLGIEGVSSPMVFKIQGNYTNEKGKQCSAFSAGTIYFRHGSKSEPGDSDDLRQFIERQIKNTRKSWFSNIRKVVEAPVGSQVKVLIQEPKGPNSNNSKQIRLVDDPNAPVYRKIDYDETHPYRQKEIIQIVNEAIGEKYQVNQHDLLCVRKVHKVSNNPLFYHKPKFATPQYSQSFADWIIEQFNKDHLFFYKARESLRNLPKKSRA